MAMSPCICRSPGPEQGHKPKQVPIWSRRSDKAAKSIHIPEPHKRRTPVEIRTLILRHSHAEFNAVSEVQSLIRRTSPVMDMGVCQERADISVVLRGWCVRVVAGYRRRSLLRSRGTVGSLIKSCISARPSIRLKVSSHFLAAKCWNVRHRQLRLPLFSGELGVPCGCLLPCPDLDLRPAA